MSSSPPKEAKESENCPLCLFTAANLTDIYEHIRQQHHKYVGKAFRCNHCSFASSSKAQLMLHAMRSHRSGDKNGSGERTNSDVDVAAETTPLPVPQPEAESEASISPEPAKKKMKAVMAKTASIEVAIRCLHCDYTATNMKLIRSHLKDVHDDSGANASFKVTSANKVDTTIEKAPTYTCDQCDFTSEVKRGLVRHKNNQHGGQNKLVCPAGANVCGQAFVYKASMRKHVVARHVDLLTEFDRLYPDKAATESEELADELTCNYCPFASRRPTVMSEHVRASHQYRCDKCDFTTGGKVELRKHREEAHIGFKCGLCGVEAADNAAMIRHVEEEHRSRHGIYCCAHCDFRTAIASEMSVHEVAKHPGAERAAYTRRFKCPNCDFMADDASEVTGPHQDECRGMPFTDGEESVVCGDCGATAESEKDLEFHQHVAHRGSPTLYCDTCDHKTVSYDAMKRHVARRHPGAANGENKGFYAEYRCRHCGFIADNNTVRTAHEKVEHGDNLDDEAMTLEPFDFVESAAPQPELTCPRCDFVTESQSDLDEHETREHYYKCGKCDFTTGKSLADLVRHYRDKHSACTLDERARAELRQTELQKLACADCDFVGKSACKLRVHIKAEHTYRCGQCNFTSGKKKPLKWHQCVEYEEQPIAKRDLTTGKSLTDLVGHYKVEPGAHALDERAELHQTERQKLTCADCDFVGKSACKLRVHVKAEHAFRCGQCNFTSGKKKPLKRHQCVEYVDHPNVKREELVEVAEEDPIAAYNGFIAGYEGSDTMEDQEGRDDLDNSEQEFLDVKPIVGQDSLLAGEPNTGEDDVDIKPNFEEIEVPERPDNSCPHCEFVGKGPCNLRSHVKLNHLHKCPECDFTSGKKRPLGAHMKAVHDVLRCTECDFTCTKKSALKAHFKSVHGGHRCPKCGDATSQTRRALLMHLRSKHLGKPTFRCQFCPYQYAGRVDYIKKHLREKHPDIAVDGNSNKFLFSQQFRCVACTFTCTDRKEMLAHKREEHFFLLKSSAKGLTCSKCDFVGAKKKDLRLHVAAAHEHMMLFACRACKFVAIRRTNIVAHVKNKHGETATEDGFSEVFGCMDCPFTAEDRELVDEHGRLSHPYSGLSRADVKAGLESTLECDCCDFSTAKMKELRIHTATVHRGKELYRCDQCEYETLSKANFDLHREKRHGVDNMQPPMPQPDVIL